MIYDIKEYKFSFDTPIKREQERAIVEKIMNLLNNNKYDDLERLIEANESYDTFLRKQHMDTVVKHFGNTLREADFKEILENMRQLTKDKQSFNTDDIKTTTIDNKDYSTYKNEELNKTNYVVNDSSKTLEEQLKDKQQTSSEFQTADQDVNTGRMLEDMEKNEKESLNLHYINDINKDILNNEELEIYNAAVNYQISNNTVIRVDIEKGIIVDPDDNIIKIENKNGVITLKDGKEEKPQEIEQEIAYTKVLTMPNTIYSDNIAA